MKKVFFYLMLVCFFGIVLPTFHDMNVVYAQASYAGASQALTELVNGIEPSMFTNKAAGSKAKWLEKTGKVNSYGDAAKMLGKLGNGLKPEAFTSSFNRADWVASLKDVTSSAGLSSAISKLVGGMKDSAFTPSFLSNKASWLSGLNGMVK